MTRLTWHPRLKSGRPDSGLGVCFEAKQGRAPMVSRAVAVSQFHWLPVVRSARKCQRCIELLLGHREGRGSPKQLTHSGGRSKMMTSGMGSKKGSMAPSDGLVPMGSSSGAWGR
jgi:hypothetical protein